MADFEQSISIMYKDGKYSCYYVNIDLASGDITNYEVQENLSLEQCCILTYSLGFINIKVWDLVNLIYSDAHNELYYQEYY